MPKCIINAKFYGTDESGCIPDHYGYKCRIEDGNLVADVPQELIESESAAGRITQIEDTKKKKGE